MLTMLQFVFRNDGFELLKELSGNNSLYVRFVVFKAEDVGFQRVRKNFLRNGLSTSDFERNKNWCALKNPIRFIKYNLTSAYSDGSF
jgi:hypothetical protein